MPMKGVELPTTPLVGIASIHEQKTVIKPFGQPDRRMVFTSQKVVIETNAGEIVSEQSNPRETFAGHVLNTYWDSLHRVTGRFKITHLGSNQNHPPWWAVM